jgi:hypothetical protein
MTQEVPVQTNSDDTATKVEPKVSRSVTILVQGNKMIP